MFVGDGSFEDETAESYLAFAGSSDLLSFVKTGGGLLRLSCSETKVEVLCPDIVKSIAGAVEVNAETF